MFAELKPWFRMMLVMTVLTGLVYPHGLACRNSPASPLRQRSQVTSDPARLVAPHYRIETLRASNETWEDVGEMTVLKG